MNWIDFLLIAIIFISVFAGWKRGFLLGSLELIGWLGSVYIGFVFYPYAAKFFDKYFPSIGVWSLPLAFVTVIIIARIILSVIINFILSTTTAHMHRSSLIMP